MKRPYVVLVALVLLLSLTVVGYVTVSGQTETEEVPNVLGKWTGPATGISVDFDPESKPGERTVDHGFDAGLIDGTAVFYEFDMQEGRRFSGLKISPRTEETVVGVISGDNKTVYMVDEDGHLFAELLGPDEMEIIYLETNKGGLIATRKLVTREP